MDDQEPIYRHAYEKTPRADTPAEADQEYMITVQSAAMAGKLIMRRVRNNPTHWGVLHPSNNGSIFWNWDEYEYAVMQEGEPTRLLRRWRVVQMDYGRSLRMANDHDLPENIDTVELVTRAVP